MTSAALTGAVLAAEVLLVEELGADALLHVRLADDSGPAADGPWPAVPWLMTR